MSQEQPERDGNEALGTPRERERVRDHVNLTFCAGEQRNETLH